MEDGKGPVKVRDGQGGHDQNATAQSAGGPKARGPSGQPGERRAPAAGDPKSQEEEKRHCQHGQVQNKQHPDIRKVAGALRRKGAPRRQNPAAGPQ